MLKTFYDTLKLAGINLPQWIFIVILISIIVFQAIIIWKKHFRPRINTIVKMQNDIKSISTMREHITSEVERATKKESEIEAKVDSINDKLDNLIEAVADIKRRSDLNEQARLKDRICQSYTHYHAKKCWTSMEKESLESLISSYEIYNSNSFVHSVVVPEMYTWKIVD